MGLEARCLVRCESGESTGQALLESDDLIFRGEFRLRIPLREITALELAGDRLRVTFPGGTASFELGANAAKWAERIRNPRTLLDKLGVKSGQRIRFAGSGGDAEFERQLLQSGIAATVMDDAADVPADLIFLFAEDHPDLAQIPLLARRITANGGVWVVAPRGQRRLTESQVLQAGRDAGLYDVKVARFSSTHTAHKFVIPLSRR